MRAAVIVVAVLLAYAKSLHGPLILDDELTVLDNQQIRSTRLSEILSPERELPVAGRPIVNLTFALNYMIGGVDVTGYHLVNVALHAACALLLFGFVRRALALPAAPQALAGAAPNLAMFAALLWSVHPLNTEAVNYITQRTELLMAFFYLLTMYASTRAIAVRATRTSGRFGSGKSSWLALAVLACAAGMACKESMVTAPVMVVIVDAVLVFESVFAALRARWRFYACLAATWIVLAALLSTGPRVHSAGLASGVGPWTYLLNQPEIILDYLKHAFWPTGLVMLYGWPMPLSVEHVWMHGLAVVLLLAATAMALIKRPPLGLLGAWFFITLAPASSVVPIATEVGAERRMYLPLMALAVLVACIPWGKPLWLASRTVKVHVTAWAVMAVVVVALGATTSARHRDYESSLRLMQSSFDARPNDVSRQALGIALADAGRREEGIALLRQATTTNPRAYYDLGRVYYLANQSDEAIAALDEFARRQPALLEVVNARLMICQLFFRRSEWERAARECRDVLRMSPSNGDARQLLSSALSNLGVALVEGGKLPEALETFRQAAAINPADSAAQRNLALAYFDHGDMAQAARHARQGLTLKPDDTVLLELLRYAEPVPPAPGRDGR